VFSFFELQFLVFCIAQGFYFLFVPTRQSPFFSPTSPKNLFLRIPINFTRQKNSKKFSHAKKYLGYNENMTEGIFAIKVAVTKRTLCDSTFFREKVKKMLTVAK